MRLIVSSQGPDMDSQVSPVFGRAPYYVLVDTEDMSSSGFENPALTQDSGAGIQAAQFVLKKDPQVILSANIGPKAFQVLSAASLPCYGISGGTVRDSVEAFGEDKLQQMGGASAASHSGLKNLAATKKTTNSEADLQDIAEKLRDLRGEVAEILKQLDSLTEG